MDKLMIKDKSHELPEVISVKKTPPQGLGLQSRPLEKANGYGTLESAVFWSNWNCYLVDFRVCGVGAR